MTVALQTRGRPEKLAQMNEERRLEEEEQNQP